MKGVRNMKYLAKHDKIWQRIKDGKTFGSEVELGEKEHISQYRQVPKPKENNALNQKTDKPKKENNMFGGTE